MSLISATNISYNVGSRELFNSVSFCIEERARIALVGGNGSGKSTLMKILGGSLEPDGGIVARKRGLRVAVVEQFLPEFEGALTLRECVSAPWQEGFDIYPYDYRIEKVLKQFGFSEDEFDRDTGTLSGGEVNRVLLARAFVEKPDLLLLDEPTNHLDLPGIQQFEEILSQLAEVALCLVSHDREVLDRCTHETFILKNGALSHFRVSFSKAQRELEAREVAARRRREAEDKEIERLRKSAAQLKLWAATFGNEKFAYRAKSIEKRIVRKEESRTEVDRARSGVVSLGSTGIDSRYALEWRQGKVTLGASNAVLAIDEFLLKRGERIAIVGANGVGKSSFLKSIVKEWRDPCEGTLRFSPQLSLGYYDQELYLEDPTVSLVSYLRRDRARSEDLIGRELIRAGFSRERHSSPVSVLSGGERARLKLLDIKLAHPNFLILDEPTNHLDILGIEELEGDLTQGTASCIVVSHDRRFVERIANRIFVIEEGRVRELG